MAFGIAFSMCGCRQMSEDIVQHAFMDVWRAAARFDPQRGSLAGWIAGIVRNRTLDAHRRQTAFMRNATRQDLDDLRVSDDDVVDAVARRRGAAAVRDGLRRLPEEQRTVLILSFQAGMSHSEIADALGLPLGTIKGRMRLGFARRQRELAPDAKGLLAAAA